MSLEFSLFFFVSFWDNFFLSHSLGSSVLWCLHILCNIEDAPQSKHSGTPHTSNLLICTSLPLCNSAWHILSQMSCACGWTSQSVYVLLYPILFKMLPKRFFWSSPSLSTVSSEISTQFWQLISRIECELFPKGGFQPLGLQPAEFCSIQ